MFLKNRNISSKIKRSKVTDYAALNDLKFFIRVAFTIFQVHVMYVTFKIALNIQVNVSNKPCLYLFACWHRFVYFF